MSPDQIAEIQRSLGRIEGALQGFDKRLEQVETLYPRVAFLEGWRKWIIGAQAAVAVVVGVMIKLIK